MHKIVLKMKSRLQQKKKQTTNKFEKFCFYKFEFLKFQFSH